MMTLANRAEIRFVTFDTSEAVASYVHPWNAMMTRMLKSIAP